MKKHFMVQVVLPFANQQVFIYQMPGKMYFTDSGPFGETSIENRVGSLFVYKFEEKSLTALCHRELAYPCGLVIDPEENFL